MELLGSLDSPPLYAERVGESTDDESTDDELGNATKLLRDQRFALSLISKLFHSKFFGICIDGDTRVMINRVTPEFDFPKSRNLVAKLTRLDEWVDGNDEE